MRSMRSVIPVTQSTFPSRCFSLCIFSHACVHTLRYRYGAHLSKEQVAELVAPHPDSAELLGSWFEHHEVPSSAVSITHGGGWLTIKKVPLAKANALLGASYQTYRHTETNETVIRTVGYSLPAPLHQYVQTVAPTTYFGSLQPLGQTSKLAVNAPTLPDGDLEQQNSLATFALGDTVPPYCADMITPTCLRLLYKTCRYKPLASSLNKIGITGYLGQYASYSDLTTFMTLFRDDAATANFTFVSVNGGTNDQSQPGIEVCLVLHVEGKVDAIFISSHRPTSISNTPSQSPSRPQTFSIAHLALHTTFLMSKPLRTRTSHTWSGLISSRTRPQSHRRSARHMGTTSRQFHRTMLGRYATCLLSSVRGASVFSSQVVTLALGVDRATQMMTLTVWSSSRLSLHHVGCIYFL